MSEIEAVEFVLRKNVTSEDCIANIMVNEKRPLPHLDFKRICVCASGPSLGDHVEDIRARQQAGWHVAAMNGSYNYLISKGIVADLFFMVDARPGVNEAFVTYPHPQTTFVIASQCDPEIFKWLVQQGAKVMIWSMFHDEAGLKAIQETKPRGNQPTANFVGALNVGHSCLVPLWAMGYKVWHLFGYDGSMRMEETSTDIGNDEILTRGELKKHAFVQPQNAEEPYQDFWWPMDDDGAAIPGVTKHYVATPTMAHGAINFPERVSYFRRLGVEMELFGDGLIPDMVRALASTEGSVTAPKREEVFLEIPAPRPRKRAVERLPIVTFKWQGHIPYFAHDVNIWGAMVDRHLKRDHELVLITDDGAGVDGAILQIPIWKDHFEHGRDWHRVKLFSEEMADIIGPRFVVMDLDTVITGALDPLLDNDHPFMAWRDPNRDQYCTALFMMDAGAWPHVWEMFDPERAIQLRQRGVFGGYDQAWISHALPGQPRWTAEDGVLSFRVDLLKGYGLAEAGQTGADRLPPGARIINFHGKHNPRDANVQAACPWVPEHWRL
jgi:hypothetical protein